MSDIYQAPTIGNAVLTVAASDATDFERARAQYRCDGTEDETEINAAITALGSNGGTVQLSAGNFYIDAATIELPQGCYLQGAGRGATIVQSGASHTLTADTGLITLTGVDDDDLHWYSGVMRMSITGDGTVTSTVNGDRPSGDATIYGIDASLTGEAASPMVQNSQLLDVAIQKCKVGWYSGDTNVRYCPVAFCDIWYCDKGFEFTDHPNFRVCDFRYNEYAIYGRASADVRFVGCKFVANDYGIDDSAATGLNICNVVGCEFANNLNYGLRVGANSVVTGNSFMMTTAVVEAKAAIHLMYYRCTISGNKFTCQVPAAGWSDGCIVLYSGERGDMCSFNDNQFTNGRGPIFGFDAVNDTLYASRRLENATISGNTFALLGYPIIKSTSVNNWWRYVNFCNNSIDLYANLGTDSVFALASPTDGGTLEINFNGNTFRNDNGAYTHASVLGIDLDGCIVANNRFSGWTTVLKSGYTTDANTRVFDNLGLDLVITDYPFDAYFDDDLDNRPFFQFGNLTADIPATSHVCFVFGGTVAYPHTVNAGAYLSGIWGGYDDTLGTDAFASHIFGSHHSSIIGNHCTVIGGGYNVITGDKPGSAIVGGSSHTIDSERAVCVGGYENNIEGLSNSISTIVGGYDHDIIDSSYSVIIGGVDNEINGSSYTCIIAGTDHVATANSPYSAIVAGAGHTLNNADFAACLGGYQNTVSANYGVCLGGRGSSVSGLYGFASGRTCAATATGAWAIGDSVDSALTNATANSLAARFAGGYRFTGGPTKPDGLDASGLPTSDPVIAGRVWVDGTTLKVSAGA